MASVKSLGLHQPAGLHVAVQELILPTDATPADYQWEILVDSTGGQEVEDQLLITTTSVVWCRGNCLRRSFRFEIEKEPVTHALLAHFPASQDGPDKFDANGPENSRSRTSRGHLDKALVVILRTQAHIYFLSGSDHIVHLPFEVEKACAAPQGVILQRKERPDNFAPVSLKFPRVPPNSFVSSQTTIFSSSIPQSFNVEGIGKPRTLPFRLSSTLENMWESPIQQPETHWPRLVCLTDPLTELGLLVTQPEPSKGKPRKPASGSPYFLDPAEEILHVEQIPVPESGSNDEQLILALTVNHDAHTYTIWRMEYLKREDRFITKRKKRSSASRRRSSMQPAFASGAASPIQPSFRESFGATLPKRRPRKSEKADKNEKKEARDLIASLEHEREGVTTRRQSRRVSSMLARADLSASQKAEQPMMGHGTARRADSHGSQRHGPYASFSHNQTIHPSLGSLLEAPVDSLIDEARSGGEGFHSMGLDDHDFDGLSKEIAFTKLKTIQLEPSKSRVSLSQPAQSQCRVFIVPGPPFAVDEHQRSMLLIGIQDPSEKRLELQTVYYHRKAMFDTAARSGRKAAKGNSIVATCDGLIRVQSVVDSCKIVDGDLSMILILSEKMNGGHELSLQGPWAQMTTIGLPLMHRDSVRSLQFRGLQLDRDVRQQKSESIELENGSIMRLQHSRRRGVVDMVDNEGKMHQVKIQLQPSSPQVQRVLDVCRNVIPYPQGAKIFSGWWHVMQWARRESLDVVDLEWTALVIEILAMFLVLGHASVAPEKKQSSTSRKKRRQANSSLGSMASLSSHGSLGPAAAAGDWETLLAHEAKGSAVCPPWMTGRAWQWALEEVLSDNDPDSQARPRFLATHVQHAKNFLKSDAGELALGASGYLPTALGCEPDYRRQAAISLFMALHLLLEEQKLDVMTPENGPEGSLHLKVLLCQVARWFGWNDFVKRYSLGIQEELEPRMDGELKLAPPIPQLTEVPCILDWIQANLTGRKVQFATLADIYFNAMGITDRDDRSLGRFVVLTPRTFMFRRFFELVTPKSGFVETVEAIQKAGITPTMLQTLPEAILAPIRDVISKCQARPPTSWSRELLELVNRTDISLILSPSHRPQQRTTHVLVSFQIFFSLQSNAKYVQTPNHNASWDFRMLCQNVDDYNNAGYDETEDNERRAVIRALFKDDRRLNEAADLLSTHKSRIVKLSQQPEWTDSEYLERQKELVARVATGTLAIPAGRGLLYFSLRFPILTQKFHIGGFNLNCVVKPANVVVGVDKAMFTEDKVCWGFFHQGVSAGLSISPRAKGIDTSWILFNKPGQEMSNRHAGFLLALGLNGHLKKVAKWVYFKYLTTKHTMTSIGLLLGLAASYMGTMDSLITRLLSVHVTRMLPHGAADLNLSPLTQTSGIMGIGLLYCNSQHRRMSEVMMSEIEHVEEEDEVDPLRSEGYRLAAGFALGLINLAKGKADLKGLHDMKLTEKLVNLATATKNVEATHVLDRAAAGAVMAIALIYMKSGDQIVARKIDVPDATVQFDYARPDILLLRTMARHVILWDQIQPTKQWIRENLPDEYRKGFELKQYWKLSTKALPFFGILAGMCFALGLRFAGSANKEARDLLVEYLDELMRICKFRLHLQPVYDEELARSYARACQDVVAVSAAMVMAGSGDLHVLRRLRSLHGRDDADTPYGSHLAAHFAVGTLFLGCGTSTLGTGNVAVAALMIGFFPVWPGGIGDERGGLQALRHFWCLAAEERCLVVREAGTGRVISVPVRVGLKDGKERRMESPGLLPPLDEISWIRTDAGQGFWDVELDLSQPPTADAFKPGKESRDEEEAKTVAEAFRKNLTICLRRRPAQEAPFASTVSALGRGDPADGEAPSSSIDSIFRLASLRDVTYAERAAVMDLAGQGDGTVVDARLELEEAVGGQRGRDGLVGLKGLFGWGEYRDRLEKQNLEGRADNGKEKEKEKGGENGKNKREEEGEWWVRSSVIEGLKGKVWLAGREE